jgi:hypothetical protein
MTNKFTKILLRGAALTALTGFGLAVTPGTARADYVTFQVNESVVPGVTVPYIGNADIISGRYTVNTLTFSGGQAQGTCVTLAAGCTWTENASASFNAYALAGNGLSGQTALGSQQPNGYLVDGTLVSNGHYINTLCGVDACTEFFFDSQVGNLFLDPDGVRGNGDDIALLTATGVAAGTGGSFNYVTNHGEFNSNFLTASVANNVTAQAYWPTLKNLTFSATVNGDTNNITSNPISGEVSAQFTAVPEPASLTLLGMGLLSGFRYARRRRAENI